MTTQRLPCHPPIHQRPRVGLVVVVALTLALGYGPWLYPLAEGRRQTAPTAKELIDEVLANAIRRQDALGLVAIAVDRQGVVYRGAFGTADTEDGALLRVDAIFRIASMTKPVTSLAAMQLVEQGAVNLDAPAATYLPELGRAQVLESFDADSGSYKLRPPSTPITVRQLLSHTAGFGYAFTSETLREFESVIGDGVVVGPLLFDPGTSWWYGTNIDWVGRLVETVSGQPLEAYFREHIFDPLQMPDTAFNVPEADWPRAVALSRRHADEGLTQDVRQNPPLVTSFNGGGGLWSTAPDYGRFLQMWLNGGVLDGTRVVSAETVRMMATNQVGALPAGAIASALPERSNDFTPTANGRGRFGLGFLINLDNQPGRRSAGSLAWAGLYNTYFWIDSDSGVAGAILSQVLPFADPQILNVFDAFEQAVYTLVSH